MTGKIIILNLSKKKTFNQTEINVLRFDRQAQIDLFIASEKKKKNFFCEKFSFFSPHDIYKLMIQVEKGNFQMTIS